MSTVTVTGAVHSFDVSTGVDGPGTRFVLFLAGCPLRCLYCENPDTWHMRDSRRMSVDDVMAEITKYQRFISVAGGGVTISGGEPLMQPAFVTDIFRRCHDLGLQTALDTSGFLGTRADDAMLAVTDLVLLDIKSWDPSLYRHVTGAEVAPTLAFARRLAERGTRMWIRFVLVPGLTDSAANVEGVAAFTATLGAAVARVEVLPFHRLGEAKYAAMGRPFPLAGTAPPTPELIHRTQEQFRRHGIPVL
jgi:pyruvate formate lyase activating enzyme